MTANRKTPKEKIMAVSALVFSLSMLFLSFSTLPWLATLVALAASSLLLLAQGQNLRLALR